MPFGDQPVMAANEALRAIAVFRLCLPPTILRFAGGHEITLGDLAKDGMVADLKLPLKGLSQSL